LAAWVAGGAVARGGEEGETPTKAGFAYVPPGTFWMGSADADPGAEDWEKPRRPVTLSRPFFIAAREVTQGEWANAMGEYRGQARGEDYPAEGISWDDAQAFLERLNGMEGNGTYRLPTEAEWERAARAGTDSVYFCGDDSRALGRYAWLKDNAGGVSHPVGLKEPNPWGLYDVLGNVWEWTADYFGDFYPDNAETDPKGPESGWGRVTRGGSWLNDARFLRSAARAGTGQGERRDGVGLRLVFEP
jgi:formylglycine-generating enzyme required for sulfatase activity